MFKTRKILKEAKRLQKTIVFPEAQKCERIIQAVEIILRKKIAKVILLGDEKEILAKSPRLKNATIINPQTSQLQPEFVAALAKIRAHKGVDERKARELLKDNFYFAAMLVEQNYADGYLGGTQTATADVLRPALQILKTKPTVRLVSSCVLLVGTKKFNFGERNVLVAADCAMNVSPTSEDLKEIALATCATTRTFCKVEPRVAMLSFSSFGSGGKEHESIIKIRKAIELVKKSDEKVLIDGEMQLDCALIPQVAKLKSPESPVAGKANVLIFPDLNSGNIGYKLMERFGKLQAVGVIMQGFKKPVNDLSRGCSVRDIVVMTAITCLQT